MAINVDGGSEQLVSAARRHSSTRGLSTNPASRVNGVCKNTICSQRARSAKFRARSLNRNMGWIKASNKVYAQVRSMRAAGSSLREIMQATGLCKGSVANYTRGVVVPPKATPAPKPPKAAPVPKPKLPKPANLPKPVVVRVPRRIAPTVRVPIVDFTEDIARLQQREERLKNGLLAATRAKSRLVAEVIAGLERSQTRAAMRRAKVAA